jgi:hypothetical protein
MKDLKDKELVNETILEKIVDILCDNKKKDGDKVLSIQQVILAGQKLKGNTP